MARTQELLKETKAGLWCPVGDFYIDPWALVDRAVITHAHSDHLRWGMNTYLCSREGELVTRLRLGDEARLESIAYGHSVTHNGVKISLHPAGHVLGSAQVRIEHGGRVAVVSGDYKTQCDGTCSEFEAVRCDLFVTESTFGLPIYQWDAPEVLFSKINDWWRANQQAGKASLLMGYPLGKSQRALAGLDASIGPIFLHGTVHRVTEAYRRTGVKLPTTRVVGEVERGFDWSKAMILAPPSATGSPWLRRFGEHSTGFMSGWMAVRGIKRRRPVDRGFTLSDHADWPGLLRCIRATGAESVWVTHGYTAPLARYLAEQGLETRTVATQWEGELNPAEEVAQATDEVAE